jgi:hypothetical protein
LILKALKASICIVETNSGYICAMPKEETYYKGKGNTNASVTTQLNKNKILEAMQDEYGAIQHSCDRAGVCVATYRNYYNNDEEFRAKADAIRAVVKEKVANSLIRKAIEKDDTLSQIFFLKTQAGWVEKRQVEITQKRELIKIVPADKFQIEEAEVVDGDTSE